MTKATITATFSNGYTDTYKGTREVKAAWAIIRKSDGAVLSSGHSLDRTKALKTAEGNLRYHGTDALGVDSPLRYVMGTGSYLTARQNREGKAHNAARMDAIRAATRIEVIDL